MFRLRSFVFMLFAIFFFAAFFSFNASAQGMMPYDLASATSSASSSSTKGYGPLADPREMQLGSINQDIDWLGERIESYNDSIQETLTDIDSSNEKVHDLDSAAEDFHEEFLEINERADNYYDNISYYKNCIDANMTKIAELTDRLDKLRKDIDENPFRSQLEVVTATPTPQPFAPSGK